MFICTEPHPSGCVCNRKETWNESEMLGVRRYFSGKPPWRSRCSYRGDNRLESRGPRTWCSLEKGGKGSPCVPTGAPGKPLLTLCVLTEVFLPGTTSSFHSQ